MFLYGNIFCAFVLLNRERTVYPAVSFFKLLIKISRKNSGSGIWLIDWLDRRVLRRIGNISAL